MTILECFACIVGGLLIVTVFLLKYSRKDVTEQEERDAGKVIQMHPDNDDPEDAITRDNYPAWRKSQEN